MTYNVLEDGSFRADLPFFGGKVILKPNGKEGDANKAVIDKLRRGRRADRAGPAEALLPAFLALQGAADLPQHAAMVRRHRPRRRRRAGRATARRSASAR